MKGKPGDCYPNKLGYIVKTTKGVRRSEHITVWEEAYGPVPRGHHIHHKNGVRHDNRLSNLECLLPLDHKRLHSGFKKTKDGEWLKPCALCGQMLTLDKFYRHHRFKPRPTHQCKKCTCLSTSLNRNKKKLKSATAQIQILTQKIQRHRNEKR